MAEEEVLAELEAVQAVYGDDCVVLQTHPPHLHVSLKPRTADVSSQQFIEAIIGIRAGPQYPEEPPHISIIDSKGLDEKRQKDLIDGIRDKASELTSYSMLVALCEEAVERLSSMNHPDGDCPLCLCPLLGEDAGSSLPFMKLMSCFHCFHCDCIIRWWNWLQTQNELEPTDSLSSSTSPMNMRNRRGMQKLMEKDMGKCPVCRKVFLAKDIEHVLQLVDSNNQLDSSKVVADEDLLHSDFENLRRQKFDAILKLQQENSGLIEPKRNEVLLPGMFLPRPVATPSSEPDAEATEQQNKGAEMRSKSNPENSSNRPGSSRQRNPVARKHRTNNSRNQVRQWIKKDNGSTK